MSLPRPLQFTNDVMDKKKLNDFVGICYELMGPQVTSEVVDEIKRLGFTYATVSGMTIAVSDITVPDSKQKVLDETAAKVEETERQYRRGLITEEEQYNKVVELWSRATDDITQAVKDLLDPVQGLGAMATSGATKGGIQPIRQLAGHARPHGRSVGPHHRPADPLELPRGPDRAGVLPEHARRAQGSGRHRAAHRGRGLSDPPPGGCGAGRHHHQR